MYVVGFRVLPSGEAFGVSGVSTQPRVGSPQDAGLRCSAIGRVFPAAGVGANRRGPWSFRLHPVRLRVLSMETALRDSRPSLHSFCSMGVWIPRRARGRQGLPGVWGFAYGKSAWVDRFPYCAGLKEKAPLEGFPQVVLFQGSARGLARFLWPRYSWCLSSHSGFARPGRPLLRVLRPGRVA
jgi:hypothetical protein